MVGSLGRLWQQPFAALLTILVIGIALALPACLHTLVQNVRAASGGWGHALDVSMYMKHATSLEDTRRIAAKLRQRRDIEEVTLIADSGASDEAYAHVKARFSDDEIIWLTVAATLINAWNRIAISSRAEYHAPHRPAVQANSAEVVTVG